MVLVLADEAEDSSTVALDYFQTRPVDFDNILTVGACAELVLVISATEMFAEHTVVFARQLLPVLCQ